MINLNKALIIATLFLCGTLNAQTISTVAGNGTSYFGPSLSSECPPDGGQGTSTPLESPGFVHTDAAGNIYVDIVVDPYWACHHLKKISNEGIITTVAGNGDYQTHSGDGGPATAAGISGSNGFCLDNAGNMYILEHGGSLANHGCWIRKVNTAGIITTIAGSDTTTFAGDGGPASAASLDGNDISIDGAGNIYITDFSNQRIRKINTSGIITTIAGTGNLGYTGDGGPATAATFDFPEFIAADAGGNVYVTDQPGSGATVVRKITTAGNISTIGSLSIAAGAQVGGLGCDNSGNAYLSQNGVVTKVSSSGVLTVVAGMPYETGFNGDGIPATDASLNNPAGVSFDAAGNMFIADKYNYRVRKVTPHSSGVAEVLGVNNALRLWPAPNNGSFTLYIPTEETGPAQITVTNTVGQVVKEISSTTNRGINMQLDVPSGLYFVTTVAGTSRQSVKMLVR